MMPDLRGNMNYPRILIAAPGSGSGKTTITCGILSALKAQNIDICSFKCGPDYIDPMFHRNVLGISSGNLDTFFTDENLTRQLFKQEFTGNMAVIEGVMGLYDGVGGVELRGSSYDLACVLKAPIVLVVDANGAGRSILAEIKGFLCYDRKNLIKGVILNRTSKSFAGVLKPLIENELGIKCLGYVEKNTDVELPGRHLGLVIPEEIENVDFKLSEVSKLITEGIDIEAIKEIAYSAEDICFEGKKAGSATSNLNCKNSENVRIAVARDEAFCFYYRENLELLERLGAKLIFFSPIKDKHLPVDISGLILGGGYPENYLNELSMNKTLLQEIKRKIRDGLPTLAECGGFMYLTRKIADKNDESYEMAGLIDTECRWTGKLVRFGYIELEGADYKIKGHEFHYFDTDNNGDSFIATKPSGKRSYSCIHHLGCSYIGFPHLYYPSCPEFAENFIENAVRYNRKEKI